MTRTLLFLSADSFYATTWQGGTLDAPRHFTNDATGREFFAAYLREHPHPTYLLIDVIEEDFRLETVPHLIGSEKRDLRLRKFEQFYRNTPFRQATLLRRQKDGRRDDEMLFSALTNPQRISPWLDILLSNEIPLVGIFSVPNIGTPLLKNIPADHVLLLSWEKGAGLRQTYYNHKSLQFSRLIPLSNGASFISAVAQETPRTVQYLKSLSLPPSGEALEVYIICHARDRQALQTSLAEETDLQYTYLDIDELGHRFKSKTSYSESDATPLFLHLMASHTPSSHYASSDHTHYHLLWQLRWLFFGVAGLTLLVSALWSGMAFWQGQQYVSETEPLVQQAAHVRQQIQQIQSGFANTTVPAIDMKTAVLLMRKLNDYSPPAEKFLTGIGKTLDKFPQIRVDKLGWLSSPADAAPSAYPAQVISLEGALEGFGSDYRRELAYLDRFQQALTQQGYTVSSQKVPLDISPKGSLSADMDKGDGAISKFSLKIIWRKTE